MNELPVVTGWSYDDEEMIIQGFSEGEPIKFKVKWVDTISGMVQDHDNNMYELSKES